MFAVALGHSHAPMIHQKIRHLRELKKLRHEDMADRLGISPSAYSRLENGETKLDVERLKIIADTLEVSADELLNSEPVVFHVQNNSGGSNGWYNQNLVQHFPEEFLRQMMERYDAHVKELQEMNKRLLALLEKREK